MVLSKTQRFASIAVIGGGLLAGGGFATFKAYARPQEGFIPEGVRVAGMDWSNKATATARAELQGWAQAKLSDTMTLVVNLPSGRTKSWNPTRAALGASIDVEETVHAAERARRDEGTLTQVASWFGKPKPIDITPRWSMEGDAAQKFLAKQVAPAVLRKPKSARFLVNGESFKVVPEQPGVQLDVEKSLEKIQSALEKSAADPVPLPTTAAAPHITASDLQAIEGEVARYRTEYGESGNRRRNIVTACAKLNGTVLKPGDVFSYNEVVGPRDEASGFRMAPVIVRGRLEPGLGGGVCQTSSTLYNAVLLSGLKVVSRNHHAFPVHYLPAGRDATVAYGSIDFKFQNNTETPIAIGADATGGRVLMRIFGKKVPGREIRIERTNVSSWGAPTERVTDSAMRAGRSSVINSGHSGHRVKVWRIVKQGGQAADRELISSDYYAAIPRVVAVGTAPRPAPRQSPAGQQSASSGNTASGGGSPQSH